MMQVLEIHPRDQDASSQHSSDIKVDPTFRKISKNSICFHIWKVEEDRIESIAKSQYGIFYDDSTYIIYAACTPGNFVNQDTISRELKSPTNIERYIHFWIGNKITPVKSGNIAFKVIELDSYFGYTTTQFREAQENESNRFLSYFKKGIRILCGSLQSSNKECKLFQIKGKKSPKCIEQENISWNNFSSTCSMILKCPTCLFVWIGRSCSLIEKRNSLNIANKMQEEYELSDLVIVDDGYEQSMNEMQKYEWNRCLSLKNRFVHEPPLIDQKPKFSLKLFKCFYQSGKYRIEECKSDSLKQSDLYDSQSVYIIDGVSLGVWIWVGKLVEQLDKSEAIRNARGFVKKKKYPSSTPIIKIFQDLEPIEFIRLFPNWICSDTVKQTTALSKIDSMLLLQRPKLAANTQLIDDGTGEKHIFRITDGRYNELIEKKNSIFFSNDCYLVHYITVFTDFNSPNICNSGVRLVVYFWIGNSVPFETRKKCELSAKNYFENLDKYTMIVQLNQGYETSHFLQMFGGKFIVFNKQNDDISIHSDVTLKIPNKFILKVYGNSTYTSKAFEIDSMIINNNEDRFIIKSDNLWIWCGQGSTGDTREVAKSIASVLGEHTLVMESKEPEEFIKNVQYKDEKQNLNGHSIYTYDNRINAFDRSKVTLYITFQIQGNFYTQEIMYFDQCDLDPENIYLLDTGNIIYIWMGSLCPKDEKKSCWQAVKEFLKQYPFNRNENIATALVQQNGEPNIFTGFFDSWDRKHWDDYITYDQLRAFIQKSNNNNNNNNVATIPALNGESDFDKHQKYPISILQQEVDNLPQGVDPIRKEVHLTHDDFVQLFKMKFSEFDSLPTWKKQELKKKHKLF